MEYHVHIADGIDMEDPQSAAPPPPLGDELERRYLEELDKQARKRLLEAAMNEEKRDA